MRVVVLTSRIPYPLEKGDKLRIFHQIRHLSTKHEICLVCLNENAEEIDTSVLKEMVSELHILKLAKWKIPFRMLFALFHKLPFQVTYFLEWKNKKKIPIYGNGLNIRDWIHVEDHCSGLFLAMKNGKPGEIYNFGDVDKVTNLEIVDNILKLMGKSHELIEFITDRLGHDMRYAVNSMKARNELNWKPKYNLINSLDATINWYKTSA